MTEPSKHRLQKIAMIILGFYSLAWISLEGRLWQSIVLATGLVLLSTFLAVQRYLANRDYSKRAQIATAGILGMFDGFLTCLLTLILMVIKTGLHSHGPEFQQSEFMWVLNQIPFWSAAGFLGGVGVGLLVIGYRKY